MDIKPHAQQQQLGQPPGQEQSGAGKHKRNPFCSRCRNHGHSQPVKGHKRHCAYRLCRCEGCKLVQDRQIISAKQIKLRRYQKQDEEFGRRPEISPPVLAGPEPDAPTPLSLASSSAQQLVVAATKKLMASARIRPAELLAGAGVGPAARPLLGQAPTSSSLSPAAHFGPFGHYLVGGGQSNSSLSPPMLGAGPTVPSPAEQVALVDEIHQAHGPLAIYAFYRAENYDQHKLRTLIELYRDAFHELLQRTGNKPLDLTSPIVD